VHFRRLGQLATARREWHRLSGLLASAFEGELRDELTRWASAKKDCDLFFINGWNEWAERNALEPSERFEHGYLNAVRACLAPTRGAEVDKTRRCTECVNDSPGLPPTSDM